MLRIKSIQFDKDFDFGFTYEHLEPANVWAEAVTVKKSNMLPGKEIMRLIDQIVLQVVLAAGMKAHSFRNDSNLEKINYGRDNKGEYVEITINRPIDNFTSHSQMKLPRAYYRPEGEEEQMDMFPSQLDRDIKELQSLLQDLMLRYLVTALMIEDNTICSTGNTQEIIAELDFQKRGVVPESPENKTEDSPEVSGEQEYPNSDGDAKIIRMSTPSTIPDVSF